MALTRAKPRPCSAPALRADRLLGEHGIQQNTPAGWQEFERQKSHPMKLALAARLRQQTTRSVKQIAARLHVGKRKSARGYELFTSTSRRPNGTQQTEELLVRKPAELTGSSIKSAFVVQGNLGKPEIVFTLTPAGSETFAAITCENVGRRLALILDDCIPRPS